MAIFMIKLGIFLLTCVCVISMLYKFYLQPKEPLSFLTYIKLSITGIISFIADTLGIGSFAVTVALSKFLGTFEDDELPPVNNGAQVLPGAIESLFFLHIIDVDLITLLTLITGTCLGGLIGGAIVSQLNKQTIRLIMLTSFSILIVLLFIHQLRLLPIGGNIEALHTWQLLVGFLVMTVCGALASAGIGLFVMVQGVLFLMNLSPLAAFPIMTTAGAMQQPLTTLVFLQQNKIPLKKTLILSFSGCIGVLLAIPLFSYLTPTWLNRLLLLVLIYNFYSVTKAYLSSRDELRSRYTLLPKMTNCEASQKGV
jgi:uncharacterized membrane protein YfcA